MSRFVDYITQRNPSREREGAVAPDLGPHFHRSLTVAARFVIALVYTTALLAYVDNGFADDDLSLREQKAFQAAIARVAPSVVRIETVGGRDRVGDLKLEDGATTGLVVGQEGWIVSSAFHFLRRPDSILVRMPDGTRKPAKLAATDHGRMIVLLSVEADGPTAVPETVPRGEIRVGQWAIALGRTFESDRPNVSVGIVSAVSRIGGRAVQTDAAASPNNYGGPLVDIRGRVIGVLTPLSPTPGEKVGRVEWYDSGIGFAVPLEDILKILPRLRQSEDLYAGLLGVGFAGREPNTAEPVVAACHPGSPAAKALKPGDRITAVDGAPIRRVVEFEDALGRHYAGDRITLQVERDGKTREKQVTLVAELPSLIKPAALEKRDP